MGHVAIREEELTDVFAKDLVMNVFNAGQWGSFRHVPLEAGMSLERMFKHIANGRKLFDSLIMTLFHSFTTVE
jgi:hypothetical protein